MDPLAGLAIAGAAVQFVDFGIKFTTKFVAKSHQIHKVLQRNAERDITALDAEAWQGTRILWGNLERALEGDARRLSDYVQKLRQIQASNAVNGTEKNQLKKLCQECDDVAQEMVAYLEQLKIELPVFGQQAADSQNQTILGKMGIANVFKSKFQEEKDRVRDKIDCFKKALLATWSESTLQSLQERLSVMRQSLELYLLMDIKNKTDAAALSTSTLFSRLESSTQQLLVTLVDRNRSMTEDMKDQMLAVTQLLQHIGKLVLSQTPATEQQESAGNETASPVVEDSTARAREYESGLREATDEALLKSIAFTSMADREHSIAEAHSETLEWIFEPECPMESTPWDNFSEWMQNGTGTYWIDGKAGSGKSTLMRYMHQHPKFRSLVSAWASPHEHTLAAHFFWNSGAYEQRSQVGLLRTLLFEILSKHRGLMTKILPGQWARKYSELSGLIVETPGDPWPLAQVSAVFRKLLAEEDMKFFFLVDGLDEYDGDHEVVATLFRDITRSSHIKACVSSRPLLVFEDAFRDCPSLRLQDLTYGDIRRYVSHELEYKERFRELVKSEPDKAPALIEEVVQKASGVFLWVVLAVRSLTSGLGNRDSIGDLQRRLLLLPADLERLYSHMLSRIDPFYQRKASEMFQLFRAAEYVQGNFGPAEGDAEVMTALAMSFADDDDADLALSCPIGQANEAAISQRCSVVGARLKVRCAGLLELQSRTLYRVDKPAGDENMRVQYLHRTVRDYLQQDEVWAKFVTLTANSDFSPNLKMLKSCLLSLKLLDLSQKRIWHLTNEAMVYASLADESGQSPHTLSKLIHNLDATTTRRHQPWLEGTRAFRTPVELRAAGPALAPNYEHLAAPPPPPPLLSRAVLFGCAGFVDDELAALGGGWPRDARGRELLELAVAPGRWAFYRPVSPRTVALLLRRGGKPNRAFAGLSPWQCALRFQWENRVLPRARGGGEAARGRMLCWLEIVEMLVEHGARPDEVIVVGGGKRAAADVIGDVFMDLFPERVRALRMSMEAKAAERRRSWFRR